MTKLDRHGLNIVGIKSASSDTRELGCSGCVNVIKYNRETGEVWSTCVTSSTYWRFASDNPCIEVCRSTHHMTMQEIADAVYCAITGNRELWGNWDAPRSYHVQEG